MFIFRRACLAVVTGNRRRPAPLCKGILLAIGEHHGTRTIALADRNSAADHPDYLAVGRITLIPHRRSADDLPARRQVVVRCALEDDGCYGFCGCDPAV